MARTLLSTCRLLTAAGAFIFGLTLITRCYALDVAATLQFLGDLRNQANSALDKLGHLADDLDDAEHGRPVGKITQEPGYADVYRRWVFEQARAYNSVASSYLNLTLPADDFETSSPQFLSEWTGCDTHRMAARKLDSDLAKIDAVLPALSEIDATLGTGASNEQQVEQVWQGILTGMDVAMRVPRLGEFDPASTFFAASQNIRSTILGPLNNVKVAITAKQRELANKERALTNMRSNLLVIRSGYTDNCIAIGAARPDVTVPPASPVIPSIEIAPGAAARGESPARPAPGTRRNLGRGPQETSPEHTHSPPSDVTGLGTHTGTLPDAKANGVIIDVAPAGQNTDLSDLRNKVFRLPQSGSGTSNSQ